MNKNIRIILAPLTALLIASGCSLSDLVNVDKHQIDSDVDHDYLDTKLGALGLLNSTLGGLQSAVSLTSLNVGVFSDELTSRPQYVSNNDYTYSLGADLDSRIEPENYPTGKGIIFPAYIQLQSTRIKAGYARYFLRRQSDIALNYAISAAYSYEGYSIILLAENLCSGVPLSKANYGQKVEYGKRLSTDSLFEIAISKFDSALTIPHDSIRFTTLARIGKARALLSLGRYKEANEAVVEVEQDAEFNLTYTEAIAPGASSSISFDAFWTTTETIGSRQRQRGHEIANNEGVNGLRWYSNANNVDPRLPVTVKSSGDSLIFAEIVRQEKFPNGNIKLKLASWIEAMLVKSEYLLSIDDPNWIVPINEARRSIGLLDIVSPTAKKDKIDLLFYERAFWFYLHGTRLSDMRRLVRQYNRPVNSVYPVGEYSRSLEIFTYSDATVFIPSLDEFNNNYAYSGCINRLP